MAYMATPLHTRTPALDVNLRHKKWWDKRTDNVTQLSITIVHQHFDAWL